MNPSDAPRPARPENLARPVDLARLEDDSLLRGAVSFLADLDLPADSLHAHFVRTTIAAGRVGHVGLEAARAAPGVVEVFDAAALGLAPYSHFVELTGMAQAPLVSDRVRHVGEAVAVVIANSAAEAADAADLVEVDLEPTQAVVDIRTVVEQPPLHDESATNLVYEIGPDTTPDEALAGSATVVELDVVNQRVASAPLENDGIIVTPTSDGLDVWATLQGAHALRSDLARGLGLDPASVRVRAAAVGGGFGGRASLQVEFLVVAAAAMRLGRTVRWLGSRSENLTTMAHGRGYLTKARLGLKENGAPVGLVCDTYVDTGSVGHMNPLLMVSAKRQAVGLYRIGRLSWRGRAVLTNTTPVGAYRGAGQPESNHVRERLIDVAARRLGRDPIEYRLEHLLGADELPRVQPGDVDYDAADPRRALRTAVELAEVDRWRQRQAARVVAADPRRIGIGVSCYAQTSGRGTPTDAAEVRIERDGRVTVLCGSPSHGQAHRTTLAALISDRLAIAPELVSLVDADTAVIAHGLSTGGSRSSQVLASVVFNSCGDLIDLARPLAAALLEVAEHDLVVEPAGYGRGAGLAVAGVPTRRVTWGELAADTEAGCLAAARNESVAGASHPYGAHITVAEVDIDTGAVRMLAHTAVDDCGVVLQPQVVQGQQHGGSAAGISQVMWEDAGHEPDGSPRGASFLTYLLPSAAEMPPFTTANIDAGTDRNPLGTRGIGENGCNGAIASAHNAVLDALADLGVEHVDLPLTPEKIWRAVAAQRPPA